MATSLGTISLDSYALALELKKQLREKRYPGVNTMSELVEELLRQVVAAPRE